MAYYIYAIKPQIAESFAKSAKPVHSLVANKYWVDEIYQSVVIKPLIEGSRWLWAKADVGFIDMGTYKLTDFIRSAGDGLRSLQTGQLQTYTLMMVVGVVVTLLLMMM